MVYGVVAPGISGVYSDYSSIERIMALYPYPKFRSFHDEEKAWEFVRRNKNNHKFTNLNKYGDTFDKMYVTMEYFITQDAVYYNFRTGKVGYIKIVSEKAIVENRSSLIKAKLPNTVLGNETITGHLIAIYYGLQLIGDFLDVDIKVPDHSILYTLMSYSGSNRVLLQVLNQIKSRTGKISYTLPDFGENEYCAEEE